MRNKFNNKKVREFPVGEIFHVYNRGTDGRVITQDVYDSQRFVQSLELFNTKEPIGSIYQQSFTGPKVKFKTSQLGGPTPKLVRILAYCLNPNHYHLLIEVIEEKGLSMFMHKLGTGFTGYFNKKYKRSGALFQGKFKARHITTDADFMKMSAYVNLNDKIHQLGGPTAKLVRSSFKEYSVGEKGICDTSFILGMFNNRKQYVRFAEKTVTEIVKYRKTEEYKEFKKEFHATYFD